jgi:hypothetical protein
MLLSDLEKPPAIGALGGLKQPITPDPEPIPVPGPSMLFWTGQARQGDLITIAGNRASAGLLSGRCPEAPSSVSVYPATLEGGRLTMFTTDARKADSGPKLTPRGIGVFTFDPRHATDLSLFEVPGTRSGRLVVRVNAPLAAFVVECRP